MRTHTRVLKTIEEVRFDIAYRWFCGFEVDDASRITLHSANQDAKMAAECSLSEIFYEIVKPCIDSGLIDEKAAAADGSCILANESRESWNDVEIEVEQSMQSYLDSMDEELSN